MTALLLILFTVGAARAGDTSSVRRDDDGFAPLQLGRFFADGDVDLTRPDGSRSWNKLYGETQDVVLTVRGLVGVRTGPRFGLFVGPTVRLGVPAGREMLTAPAYQPLAEIRVAGRELPLWLGFTAGFRFR